MASAKTPGLPLPARAVIVSRLREAIAASRMREAIARLAVHAPGNGSGRHAGRTPVMSCLVRPFDGCPAEWYAHGVPVVTAAVRRPGPRETASQVKGNDYLNALTGLLSGPAIAEAAASAAAAPGKRAPGLDPLFLTEAGTVSETSVANLLILKDGAIWTPPASCGILLGVTRLMVLEAARELGLNVLEAPFTRHDIYNADEVFLTNAAVEVLPAVEVDRRRIGAGAPGPWAPRLRAAYLDLARGR